MFANFIYLDTGLEDSMGHFGHAAGHTDDGDDEAGLTCMISNSRIPEDYEPGRFHLLGSGMYTVVKPKSASLFSGLGRHGGTPPIAPLGVEVSPDATRLMIVFYCPKAALSPDGLSMPLASLPNRTPLLLGPEVTRPLCVANFHSWLSTNFILFSSPSAALVKLNLQTIQFGHGTDMLLWKRYPI